MNNFKNVFFLLFLALTFNLHAQTRVVKLIPPKIDESTISERIVCTRPMRDGKFNISLENDSGKTIVNCYGHGGSGWTTLFGSVYKAIDLYENTHPNKKTPIQIIGAGCMGLTCAIELHNRGYNVVGITAKELYNIPSWSAAGYFALVSVKTSPEEQEDLNEIGLNTFLTYQKIDQKEHPYISKEAVRFLPVYCSTDTESGVEDLEARGYIPPKELVALDFGNNVVHHNFYEYKTYFLNTTNLMKQLHTKVKKLNIPIKIKTINSFADIKQGVVFNCTGLGSRELNKDELMIPVRGHLVTLNDLSGSDHMDYMIYTKVKQDGKDEYVYLFSKDNSVTPKHLDGIPCRGVLGGTFIAHADKLSPQESAELDKIEFHKMLDRNSQFFLGKPFKE